jgi:hypothetical protein
MTGLDPVYPQRGPYEASEGIYRGRGQKKNWGWARRTSFSGPDRQGSPGPYIKTRKKRRPKPAFTDIENHEAIKT